MLLSLSLSISLTHTHTHTHNFSLSLPTGFSCHGSFSLSLSICPSIFSNWHLHIIILMPSPTKIIYLLIMPKYPTSCGIIEILLSTSGTLVVRCNWTNTLGLLPSFILDANKLTWMDWLVCVMMLTFTLAIQNMILI